MSGWGAFAQAMSSTAQILANRKSDKRNLNFQRDMSNTSYARAMADLRNAGLNPILAGRVGGASTPSGSSSSHSAPDFGGTAIKAMLAREQVKNLRADTAQKVETANLAKNNADKAAFETSMMEVNTQAIKNQELKNLQENNNLIRAQIEQTRNSAKATDLENVGRDLQADIYDSAVGEAVKALQMLNVSPSIINNLVPRRRFHRRKP